jgi:transcriptional regulator with GAF, ATPase, and Fis domain
MPTPADSDLTLPSIATALPGRRSEQLLLTIIFHPDTSRIGHTAAVTKPTGNAPWILGRRGPAFRGTARKGRDECNPRPLDDPHISRSALQFTLQDKRLTICRLPASSRCQVGGRELYDSVELETEQLRAGVPLLLGHCIVLLLRLDPGIAYPDAGFGCDDLLHGSSSCMTGIREQVARVGDSELDVLIRGATGTGKELVATAIHRASRRAAGPLVSVNMAAIPSELASAALFGSARGAFTGADRAVPGYFEQAQGGTLFLDEIGDTAVEVQPLLLRALQQREIQAVGGAIRRVDVRVISATDADLEGESCDFKAALRHRLGACEIVLPALREHPEDIGELLLHFLHTSASAAGRSALLPGAHSEATEVAAWAVLFYGFLCYRWPGNVRELANFAQQLVLSNERLPTLNHTLQAALASARGSSPGLPGQPVRRRMQDISDEQFDRAMDANGCEVQRVARQLGVSRAAVYRRIAESTRYRLAGAIAPDELQRLLQQHGGDSAAVARHLRVSMSSLRSQLRRFTVEPN